MCLRGLVGFSQANMFLTDGCKAAHVPHALVCYSPSARSGRQQGPQVLSPWFPFWLGQGKTRAWRPSRASCDVRVEELLGVASIDSISREPRFSSNFLFRAPRWESGFRTCLYKTPELSKSCQSRSLICPCSWDEKTEE